MYIWVQRLVLSLSWDWDWLNVHVFIILGRIRLLFQSNSRDPPTEGYSRWMLVSCSVVKKEKHTSKQICLWSVPTCVVRFYSFVHLNFLRWNLKFLTFCTCRFNLPTKWNKKKSPREMDLDLLIFFFSAFPLWSLISYISQNAPWIPGVIDASEISSVTGASPNLYSLLNRSVSKASGKNLCYDTVQLHGKENS